MSDKCPAIVNTTFEIIFKIVIFKYINILIHV